MCQEGGWELLHVRHHHQYYDGFGDKAKLYIFQIREVEIYKHINWRKHRYITILGEWVTVSFSFWGRNGGANQLDIIC
ncbi:hypothetical protein J27TS7_30340 [Paenibacillus dendritiformis]|nr:hypothetical protein J27TS7_30340 [Paenibacillus dendritiformis]